MRKHVKINPFLYIYPDPRDQRLVVLEPFEKRYFQIGDDLMLDLLIYGQGWKSQLRIIDHISSLTSFSRKKATKLLGQLIEQNIFIDNKHPIQKVEGLSSSWFAYHWNSALFYYLASRDYTFLDYSKKKSVLYDRALMQQYRQISPPPSVYKQYTHSSYIKLPKVTRESMQNCLYPPQSDTNGVLTISSLSKLLYLTFGKTKSLQSPIFNEILLKTSPSGGARHPTEAYVMVLKDIGIPIGVYHYSVKRHGLELLNKINLSKSLVRYFFQLNHVPDFQVSAVIVITSLFERSMWRYREPRSFRVILFDIGHIICTLKVISRALGLDAVVGHGLDDQKVSKLLKLKVGEELPFHFAAIGTYPSNFSRGIISKKYS